MLTEFAFTPSIFDEDAHQDKEAWRDQLKELGRSMFPRVSAWPVVVSDLYAGSWNRVADQIIKKITDQRARVLCEGILQNMKRTLVSRPVCGDWPDEDVAWGREAIASHRTEPIERIVSVRRTKDAMASECALIRSIDEVQNAGFWRGIDSDASPRMVIAEQVALLRKLCLHSEWAALINPYAFSSEQDFSLQLLDIALNRHLDFGSIRFELHAQAPDVIDPIERQKRQQNVMSNIERKIRPKLGRANFVDLFSWPRLLDRILLAGNYVKDSAGNEHKRPRWGVSMSHVAHGVETDAPPTEWKLLRRERLDFWFREFVAEDAKGKPTPVNIGPVV